MPPATRSKARDLYRRRVTEAMKRADEAFRGKRPLNTVWTGRKCPEMIAGWMRLESVHECDHGHNHSTDHCGR